MQDLRLVGVHDGGEHLLLSGTGGEIYRLRIDEALRVAASRNPHRSAGATTTQAAEQSAAAGSAAASGRSEPAVHLSPRDIQARIRAGATAEEVAVESGLDLARIERYEGPVSAERDYTAQQAQKVEVATALPGHDGYRSAFGDNPANLGEMVAHRLTAYGLDSASVEWDAWRRPDGSWDVVARFDATPEATAGIGEQPPAQWIFNPSRKSLHNSNRWAQVLSEMEPMDGPVPARRLSAVTDQVFDFEAEKDDESAADSGEPEASPADPGNLLDVLRSRRGQRMGADEDEDDALAMMLSRGSVPAAHPRDGESADEDAGTDDEGQFPPLSLAPTYHEDDNNGDDGANALHDGVSTETREITLSGAPGSGNDAAASTDNAGPAPAEPDDVGNKPDRPDEQSADQDAGDRKHVKPKRSSIPSWDEIVFGTKTD